MIDKNNLFHGSNLIVEYPEIRLHKFTKDFSWGFYCTNSNIQAEKFTKKYKTNKVDDVIWDYVSDYIEGKISKPSFMEFAKFRKPTHQISFHTVKALTRLKFERSYIYND